MTLVSEEQSAAEVARELRRAGVERHALAHAPGAVGLFFRARGKDYRVLVPMPDPCADAYADIGGHVVRLGLLAATARKAEVRRERMRALSLAVRAKLRAAACQASTLEDEFLAALLLPDGRTVGDVHLGRPRPAYPALELSAS